MALSRAASGKSPRGGQGHQRHCPGKLVQRWYESGMILGWEFNAANAFCLEAKIRLLREWGNQKAAGN
jgi:hypothetical protein